MKAMVLQELGGPEKLGYDNVPEPEPGPGETVVRLHAAALNRRDLFATEREELLEDLGGRLVGGLLAVVVFLDRVDLGLSFGEGFEV